MTKLAQLNDCHSCNDARSIVQKKKILASPNLASPVDVFSALALMIVLIVFVFFVFF